MLFPKGLVSPTQERQLTCWGDNVRSFAVRGRFDDCQRMVKQAFADAQLRERFELSSANSINLGRLLPQMVYYWAASLRSGARHRRARLLRHPERQSRQCHRLRLGAQARGADRRDIVLAHNANRTVPDYLARACCDRAPSVATLSSAMDVGNPSNLERLSALYPDAAALRRRGQRSFDRR